MSDKYFTVNIRAYLDKDEPTYIGEESLYDLLSDFSCPENPDVEYFLLHNAIEFTKKDQSITYLVFDAEDASLVGYFSLTVKPISVQASNISKTMAKKLSRVSILDEETQSYTTAAYLIAQLGKNYSLPKEKRIPGNILLGFALETISNLQYSVGGVIEFLECTVPSAKSYSSSSIHQALFSTIANRDANSLIPSHILLRLFLPFPMSYPEKVHHP